MTEATTIPATPTQVFEGHAVGVGGTACCSDCQRTVRDGDPVGIYAYRTADSRQWDVASLFCVDCRQASVTHPTLGAGELVLNARAGVTSDVATQSAALTLREPTSVQYSPPGEGAEP